jgi:solute carrier family 39 (zinc transporter), member 1/2/3
MDLDWTSVVQEHANIRKEPGDNSDVIVAKIVTMVVLFVTSTILGLLPLILSRKFKWMENDGDGNEFKTKNRIVVGLFAFGGGVLFATTFLHLLPDVNKNIELLQGQGVIKQVHFNLASLLMCTGFFAMYLIEESVHHYLRSRMKRIDNAETESTLVRTMSFRHSIRSTKPPTEVELTKQEPVVAVTVEAGHGHNHHGHSHMPIQQGDGDSVTTGLRGLLIVLALSVHELFEGLAIGLESTADSVWYMFGAVASHKLVIAFCIGVELATSKTSYLLSVVYILTYSIVSAVGIGIGIAMVGGEGAAANLTSAIFQGLATGTLLYVTFFEILQKDKGGFIQFIGALIGFVVMFGLQFACKYTIVVNFWIFSLIILSLISVAPPIVDQCPENLLHSS